MYTSTNLTSNPEIAITGALTPAARPLRKSKSSRPLQGVSREKEHHELEDLMSACMDFRCMRNPMRCYTRGVPTDFPTLHKSYPSQFSPNTWPPPLLLLPFPFRLQYCLSTRQSTMASCSQPSSHPESHFRPLYPSTPLVSEPKDVLA